MDTNRTPNHICKCCGQAYYSCESCEKRHSWKAVCDSESHYKIYSAIVLTDRGIYSKAQAKEFLATCDLSDLNTYKASIKQKIISIMNRTDDFKEEQTI